MTKKILKIVGAVLLVVLVVGGGWAWWQISAFNASMSKVYDLKPLDEIHSATDPAAIERGRHIAVSLGGCTIKDCHGADLGGGNQMEMGPVGKFACPNISQLLPAYSDGELARLFRFGVAKGGRPVYFMPSQDFAWLNDGDLSALIGYLRTVPRVDRPNGVTAFRPLGKILDRRDMMIVDTARRLVGKPVDLAPAPSPTREYGQYISHLCQGCHGMGLGGGPLPGAPPSLPVPRNLTPHETGLGANYPYEQFLKLVNEGVRRDGQKLDPFMPIAALAAMDDTEKRALYEYLRSLEPRPFGSR